MCRKSIAIKRLLLDYQGERLVIKLPIGQIFSQRYDRPDIMMARMRRACSETAYVVLVL